jgi:hypothetical protein
MMALSSLIYINPPCSSYVLVTATLDLRQLCLLIAVVEPGGLNVPLCHFTVLVNHCKSDR